MPKLCADPSVPYFPTPFAVGANAPDEPCVLQPRAPTVFLRLSGLCQLRHSRAWLLLQQAQKFLSPISHLQRPYFPVGKFHPFGKPSGSSLFSSPSSRSNLSEGHRLACPPLFPYCAGHLFFCWSAHPAPGLFSDLLQGHFQGTLRTLPALQQAPDRRTCHGQKMEEILDRARTCALFL